MNKQTFKFIAQVAFSIVMMVLMAVARPAGVWAATSGGATIYNTIKVKYYTGSATLFATANISLTVTTVSAAPTVVNPTAVDLVSGASATYVYMIKSNSNGLDTYSTSNLQNTPANVGGATNVSITDDVQLWGGITVGASNGTISVPYGTTSGLTTGSTTVMIGTNKYTVASINVGSPASTNSSGNLIAEVPTTIRLTPIGSTPAVTSSNVPAGTQVGEYKSSIVVQFTAGEPCTAGTDGTYTTVFIISSTITPVQSTTTTPVITDVPSPKLIITRTANPSSNVASGGTIVYTVTITNSHASASATGVNAINPVPAYTHYVANSTRLNGVTVAADGTTSPMVTGLLVDNNSNRTPGAVATGILGPGQIATIVYSVTVD